MKPLLQVGSWFILGAQGALCGAIALGSCSAMGQAAASLLAVPGAAVVPGSLGQLILSPEQRRDLEALRTRAGNLDAGIQVLSTDPSHSTAPGLPDALVVSGVVIRSGNRSTVWLNGEPLYGRVATSSMRTLAGQAGVLQPGSIDMQLKAKPGQLIDVPSGQAVDLLPPGAIRIIPPKTGAGVNTKKEQ